MKSISYSSSIYNTDNLPSVLESSFTLVKQFNCFTKDNLFVMIDKLERLKNEDFNRVHIPDFEYKVDGNILNATNNIINNNENNIINSNIKNGILVFNCANKIRSKILVHKLREKINTNNHYFSKIFYLVN